MRWRVHVCLPWTQCWRDWREDGDPVGVFARPRGSHLHNRDHWHAFWPGAHRRSRRMWEQAT